MKVVPMVMGISLIAYAANAQKADIVPRNIVSAALTKVDCVTTEDEAIEDGAAFDVDRGVKLVVLPCIKGAYNETSILIQVDTLRPADAKLLQLMNWSRDNDRWEKVPLLFNVEYDAKTKRIKTLERYRGITDCGSSGEYGWSGGQFKLIAYWLKANCDGIEFKPGQSKWRLTIPH